MHKSLFAVLLFSSSISISQTTVLFEDFQSEIPITWEIRDIDGQTPDASVSEYTAGYISKIDPDDTTNLTASSTSYFSPVGTANRWLITPPIVLGAYGNAFEWRAKSHDASYPETYLVLVSTTDNLEASFTDTLGYVIQEDADWITRSVNLSANGYDNATIYVAFILQTDDGFKFYLDDVKASKEDPVGLTENLIVELSMKTIESGLYEINSAKNFENVLVYNEMGMVISDSKSKTIDIRKEKSGLYFVRALDGTQLFVSKLIKN